MKNLVAALVKFQKEVPTIPKNKKNPFFNSYYAELSTVIDCCSPALNKNGLAIIQTIRLQAETQDNILVTMLLHESGESIESSIYLPKIADPQKLTAAITYLRRSSYLAIAGLVADEDDDGNSVSNKLDQPKPRPQQQQASPSPQSAPLATEAQKNALRKLKIPFSEGITKNEASALIAMKNKINTDEIPF
jgi:hypothetical protein